MSSSSTSQSTMEIDPEIAKRLLIEGGTLVLLNVPECTEFGVDMKTWTTGKKFKGVKMIPPGVHMIYYSAVGKYGDVAPRISFLHEFKKSEFLVKKWDIDSEEISKDAVPQEEVSRLKENLLSLDEFLGPYPFDTYTTWRKLSDHISPQIMQRITPECGIIRSAVEYECTGEVTPRKRHIGRARTAEEKEEELLPELNPAPGTGLRFTPLPTRCYPEGSSAQEITKHSLDQSFTLESMISSIGRPIDIIGELQFTFLCFLLGQSLEALESWKILIKLLCNCKIAVTKYRHLYHELLLTLEAQLEQIPEDFLVDIVSSNNVIYTSLRELFRSMEDSDSIEGRLKCEAKRLSQRLTEKFCWDFEDLEIEEGDEAPVVVELG